MINFRHTMQILLGFWVSHDTESWSLRIACDDSSDGLHGSFEQTCLGPGQNKDGRRRASCDVLWRTNSNNPPICKEGGKGAAFGLSEVMRAC